MVVVAQLVRAPVCGSGGRGFESHLLPYSFEASPEGLAFFVALNKSPTSILVVYLLGCSLV